MAYHEITRMDVFEVLRRWHDHHSISGIAKSLGYDRKTVRAYIRQAQRIGLSPSEPLPAKEAVLECLKVPEAPKGRTPHVQELLAPHLAEIIRLVQDPEIALKPKSAFEVVAKRYELWGKVSYPSFKRFARAHRFELETTRTTCRIEAAPGKELQIDYCLICLWPDPVTGKRRRLYAFIGTLAHSRLKYVELTFGQDQKSFVASHVRMFEAFGGAPSRIILDNLKAGVLKPDLYDPHFNHAYRELAEHYGVYLDPARVQHPRDKGKVERDVRTVREAARKILHLNPGAPLAELNQAMRHWSFDEYGQRLHGTTGERPFVVFQEREKPALKALPEQPFELAEWKLATVHPDHYIQFHGKPYSVPDRCVGRQVWLRAASQVLRIFYQDELVRQHVMDNTYRHTDFRDFPENVRAALDTSTVHKALLAKAEEIGPAFHRMVRELLEFHAFVNLRRAQGLVAVAEGTADRLCVEQAAQFMTENRIKATPHDLRAVLERLTAQEAARTAVPPLSAATQEFVRDASYFIHTSGEGEAA